MNRYRQTGVLLVFLGVFPAALNSQAQDSTGFIGESHPNFATARTQWTESWLTGEWYNFSFSDNFGFTYRYYSPHIYYPYVLRHGEQGGFGAAMGNLNTLLSGLQFFLLGYVVEDSVWCYLHPVLSPNYIQMREREDGEKYYVKAVWSSWQEFRGDHPPRHLYDEYYVEHNYTMWGRLPPNKTVQVWYGVDNCTVNDAYRDGDLIIGRDIYVWKPIAGEEPDHYDTWNDYFLSGSGLWAYLGDFYVEGPGPPPEEEPPGWAKCTFVDWIYPSGVSAANWLPEPDSTVGLVFRFERQDVPARVQIRYNVNHISTWQGQAMNFPVDAPIPVATGTGEHFDYTIPDPDRYDAIDTLDFDLVVDNPVIGGEVRTDIASVRRYVLTLDLDFEGPATQIYDTLWLKAQDYGAHAWVSPSTGQTWRDLMQLRTTAFGQHVWSVSVPRDDDGQAFLGYNWGDFMADAWEEQMLNLPAPSGDSAVVRFVPFYQYVGDSLKYADRDSIPEGRNIKGDGFCNWEEYRGFITVGDQFVKYSAPQHKRLNPFFKNVMVHFMPNAESRPYAPGWMNALPDMMAYLVDHLTHLEDTDSFRLDLNRTVNVDRFGASYPYYSSKPYWDTRWMTTNEPADKDGQNAVVFWAIYRGTLNEVLGPFPKTLGYTIGYEIGSGGYFIPNSVIQTVVQMDTLSSFVTELKYYRMNPDSILPDRGKLIRLTIAHEFGHNIAMEHYLIDPKNEYIMTTEPLTDPENLNKLVLDPPGFTRQYSGTSKSEITILKEEE